MIVTVRAPGRVNLIGEHTDYNDGFVLPVAVEKGIELKAISREDTLVNAAANDLGEKDSFDLHNLAPGRGKNWTQYLAGVCWALQEDGFSLKGADITFQGSIPMGAGLSSSAALEVAATAAMAALNGLDLEAKHIAVLSRKAENDYVGVRCGIMDQFASALSREDRALFIDCRSLEYRHVPLNPGDYVICIVDSRVERRLASSEYNRRREECEEALALIANLSGLPKKALRDVAIDELEMIKDKMPVNLYSRSRFVVEENLRVLEAVNALEVSDLKQFGQLMNSSHEGLRNLYMVSCRELDMIVDVSREIEGVLGARMTGAGFGGCAVALVHKDAVEDYRHRLLEGVKHTLAEEPRIYQTKAAGGFTVEIT